MAKLNHQTSLERVFITMRPRCFYRVSDIAIEAGIGISTARYALRQLAGGGAIEMLSRRPMIFLTRQEVLHDFHHSLWNRP